MSLERFLKVVDGKAVLVSIYGNKIRTYYSKDVTRVDWYNREQETVLIQLASGKSIIVNKNASIVRVI